MRISDVTLMQAVEKIKMPTQYETERFMTIAIGKQIPMKLKDDEEFKGRFFYCPKCEKLFCGNDNPNYCSDCGQKLDWDKN